MRIDLKSLFLIRHAKSSWRKPELSDFQRPLNNRGQKDAPFMGKRLKKFDVKPDIIISSPANRALKTAKIIAQEIQFSRDKIIKKISIYEGTLSDLIKLINNFDNSLNRVMLFGHNPDITSCANYFCNYHVENIPTCGIYCIEFQINSWKKIREKSGTFSFFDYPKKHVKI